MKSIRAMKSIASALAVATALASVTVPTRNAEAGVLLMAALKGTTGKSDKARMLLESTKWTGGYAGFGLVLAAVGVGSGMIVALFFGAATLDNQDHPSISELEARYAQAFSFIENPAVIRDLADATYAKWNQAEVLAEDLRHVHLSEEEVRTILYPANLSPEQVNDIVEVLK